MYGIIHCAAKEMVVDFYGIDMWNEVSRVADVSAAEMLALESYSDDLVWRMVAAIASIVGVDESACLERFGYYWVTEYAARHYSLLLPAFKSDPFEFIEGLNAMHDGLSAVFVEYSPPRFDVQSRDDNRMVLKYESFRVGLTPFLIGILRGLEQRTGRELRVTVLESTNAILGAARSVKELSLIEIIAEDGA